jgi:transposase InsO family protein
LLTSFRPQNPVEEGHRSGRGVAKRGRPYRPQTNCGKIERFHRTLADGWAFARLFGSESARRKALPAWLHEYNHHRPHTAIGNRPRSRA